MIDTVNSAPDHWTKGTFSIGTGPEVILVQGACRVVPYVNYLNYLNFNNRFTIHLMNVVNYNWVDGKKVEGDSFVTQFETNPQFLDVIKRTKWFIHEHVMRYGMVNNDRSQPKNIYQYGMAPELDITLPNFNNVYPLFQELVTFDAPLRAKAMFDFKVDGQLSKATQNAIAARGRAEIWKFISLCWMSSLPEFAELFESNWRTTRYFWTGSHVSNRFTMEVFRLLNSKYLHLNPTPAFWEEAAKHDMFASPATPITQYDVAYYDLKWPQPFQPLTL